MPLFIKSIDPELQILGPAQQFIFNQNLASLQFDNTFTPTISIPSQNFFETRNKTLSGFRWIHTTTTTDTFGSYKLQSFVNAQSTGTDILLFNADGTTTINNLNATSPFKIQYNAPFSALYLVGPSFTQAGFVYSNTSNETLLFSATDLRISSTSGQIHFSLDSGTNDFITFNNQGFKSIVNFIANNPDTSGFIPEKGLIFQTLGTDRGALTFDRVANQLKLYTSTNDPIVFATNNINSMQILTTGNIDLFNHRITNAANPVNPQDYATKNYVDNIVISPTITITGAVSGSGTGTVNTVLNPTQSVIGDTQLFNYNSNPIARFGIINLRVPTVGVPCFTTLDLTSSSNNGYKFLTTFSTTDVSGLGQFALQGVTNTSTPINVFTVVFNSSIPTTTFNGPVSLSSNRITNLLNPINAQDSATKIYVDDSISNFSINNPITLTGAVTGINSINNPIFTTFASTIPVSGASQIFNFSLNSNVVYRLNNTLAATTGTPSTIALSLNNATNGGYRLLHTSTSTDPAGLGTLKLQALNSSGVTADVFTASVNPGNGITDTLFNSTATFNNLVTIQNNQSLLVTGNSLVADYLVMNNTNLSSKTQLRINLTGLPVATFGYDGANSQVYIDSPFGAGSPFVIKFGGNTKFSMDNITGNINLFSSRITNAANPVNAQDYTTKSYVDSLVTAFGPNVPLNFSGLNFNWTYTSGTNPTPYVFTNTFTDSQESKNFKYRVLTNDVLTREWNHEYTLIGNSDLNGIYKINYSTTGQTFTPINIVIYPFATSQNLMTMGVPINMGGFEIRNALNPTTPQSLATKSYVDSILGGTVTLTGAVTGTGTGTIATTLTPTVNVNSASYAFNLNNANNSGITEFQISYGIPYLIFGVNSAGAGNYIDSVFDNFIIKMGGTTRFTFASSGNMGIGGSFLDAKLVVTGGVQNITNEESAIRAIGSLNSIKIELQNTSASGRLYELRSSSTGLFDITDRTANATRFTISPLGNIGIGGSISPNAPLQFGNSTANRKIVLWETANNDHQYYGLGINNGSLRYQIDATTAAYVWYAATGSTSSNELMRLDGNANLILTSPIVDNHIYVNNTNASAFANDIFFLNNGAWGAAFGFNNSSNEAYMWSYGTAAIKFGTAAIERFRITPAGDSIFQNTIYGRRVSGTMSMQNNAIGTTVTTAGIYYKVAGTTIASNLNNLSSPVSNRLTHTAPYSVIAYVNVTFTASHNGAGGEETTFALYKNGAQLTNTLISGQQLNNLQVLSIYTTVSMATNDFIELWCTSPNNGRVITVKHLMFNYTTT